MGDPTMIDEKSIEEIRKTYGKIKVLDEEKKSLSEDIREIKISTSKKTGLTVKDLNNIFKVLTAREKGDFNEDYVRIAQAVEGILDPSKIGVVNMGGDNDNYGADDESEEESEEAED
jgi:uncharacterized protein (UPF0335 family)